MVVCVLIRRFGLLTASRGREALLGEPAALAPEAGHEQVVGEVSAAAEAFGVVEGMRVGEALARCPELTLLPPDPEGVRALWGDRLDRLERIGATPESDRLGTAFFCADGLRGIHGGHLEGVLVATRRAVGPGARLGAAPSRFSAYAAALRARARRSPGRPAGAGSPESHRGAGMAPTEGGALKGGSVVCAGALCVAAEGAHDFLAPLPVGLLRSRLELAEVADMLERLGVRTLGELAALPAPAVAERFGHPGLLALELSHGRDTPLLARRPPEPVVERLELPEAALGPQLERALELLIARVLARPERRGRSLRAVALSARFVEGGTWRTSTTLRRASADPARLRTALSPKLMELPAPAESIGVEVEAFGSPAQDQGRLLADDSSGSSRAGARARLGEAVRQARQAAGDAAALRVLEVDPGSRVPERRAVLAPLPDEEGPA